MMLRLFIWILFCIVFVTGCRPVEFEIEQQLIDFVRDPDNGLRQTQESNGITITVTYKPTDLLVSQELRNRTLDESGLLALRQKYEPYYYFLVSLSEGDKEALNTLKGMENYSDLVQTMSFRMGDYVTLTTNAADTIPLADYILNRTFNMSAATDLLFVFSRQRAEGKEWVQFNLNEFGLNTGNHRFRFLKKDLDQIPQINFLKTPTP